MIRSLKLAILIVVFAAQLAAPAWMLGKREWVLQHGTAYKFRTAPVDPYDAFRGRYVALSFEELTIDYTDSKLSLQVGRPVYASLAVDDKGFAKFAGISKTPPESGDYMQVDNWYVMVPEPKIRLVPPFDRYYMNEQAAPEAERAYREHSNIRTRDAYITVRVLNGYAVLDGLYIGDQRMEDFLKAESATPETPR